MNNIPEVSNWILMYCQTHRITSGQTQVIRGVLVCKNDTMQVGRLSGTMQVGRLNGTMQVWRLNEQYT